MVYPWGINPDWGLGVGKGEMRLLVKSSFPRLIPFGFYESYRRAHPSLGRKYTPRNLCLWKAPFII